MIDKATAVRDVTALVNAGFDVFVNLCDGAWDEDRAGIEVVQALERLGAAFTGAGSGSYDPTREAMKRACHYAGLATPEWAFAKTREDAARIAETLPFPMIVKHPNSYGSIGMGRDARVETAHALAEQVARTAGAYGEALVEQFIEGREFTVLVAEPGEGEAVPRAYRPVEFSFAPGESFKHFDLKWIDFRQMGCHPVEDPDLAARLCDRARSMFTAVGASGYGRCDLRMDARGELYLLEINPNCGVFYVDESEYGSADFILQRDPGGHRGFLEHILRCALLRQSRNRKRWRIARTPTGGFGMFAVVDLAAADTIEAFENKPQPIVTRRHVARTWDAQHRRWFAQYAWPLSEEVFAVWSDRPEDWRPIDHSCDPTSWLDGLDLVARRAVRAGEAITLDYATFSGPTMENFVCACGAASCRKIVRASDHLEPWLEVRYGEHVSDYVRHARRAAKARAVTPGPIMSPGSFGIDPDEATGERSLRALVSIEAGVLLADFGASQRVERASRHTVQAGEGVHLELTPELLRYVDHSCDPNVYFDVDRMLLVTLKPVRPAEKLCAFYPSTEWSMVEPFHCTCGAAQCLGRVAGAAPLGPDVLGRYRLSPHVRSRVSAG